jgi:hypothetical protein
MDVSTPRRRFLQSLGAGTALSVAGCNALQNQNEGSGGGGERTVAVAVSPDQQALQQRRQEIIAQARSGELSQSEARSEIQTARSELLADATEAFEGNVSSAEGVGVDGSVPDLGVYLVTGDPGAIIDLLSVDAVGALLPESAFDRAEQQAGATAGAATGTATGTSS